MNRVVGERRFRSEELLLYTLRFKLITLLIPQDSELWIYYARFKYFVSRGNSIKKKIKNFKKRVYEFQKYNAMRAGN